jgi:bifunctional N-acetylglucosamine-1-phosphate-uridyltransferase/glucosamine-1-phosphate-acetyltransferase GlmU-like protein
LRGGSGGVIGTAIADFSVSPFADRSEDAPWRVTADIVALVEALIPKLGNDFRIDAGVAVHRSAVVEPGAVVKAPAIIGEGCFIASGAYLRGGCWLEAQCILGPGAELKTTLMFAGSKLAHFNFVGDSIIGSRVNIEAGAIIANYRNEQPTPAITLVIDGQTVLTGSDKFGALVGDGCRIGANAVIAPGAILAPRTIVPRLKLVDQSPQAPR